MLVPHRVVTCLDELAEINGEVEQVCLSNFFCAYHSHIEGGTSNEIIYADIPCRPPRDPAQHRPDSTRPVPWDCRNPAKL